jgi:4-azaleucine resistance transporter AzlC
MEQPTPVPDSPVVFTRGGVMRGMRMTVPVGLGVMTYDAVFGALANQAGVTFAENAIMNVIVFAGASETAALEQWSYPLPVLSIVFTVLLINLRLILLGASVRPWLGGLPPRQVYPMLHLMSDEGWSVAMNARRHGERDAGVFLGTNAMVAICWIAAILAGHVVGGRIGDPAAVGLDFAFTLVFAAMLFGSWRGRIDLLPWTTAAIAALVGFWLFPGTWYVVMGGIAGCAMAAWKTHVAA